MSAPTAADGPLWRLLRYGPWVGAGALLLAPLIAMEFTDQVDWTSFDFAAAGLMFLAVLVPWELALRASASAAWRLGAGVALGTSFLIVWSSLAVGVIGSEDNPANLLYFVVIGVALVFGVVSGFRANGMFRATLAAAVLQLAVGAVALVGNLGADGSSWPVDLLGATGLFTLGWLIAAGLFRRAALEARD